MSPTAGVNSSASGTGSSTLSSALNSQLGGEDQFLQLLIAQLQNQDPLQPTDSTQFVAELAQFSTLDGVNQLNTNFANMFQLQQLTGGSSLIGKTATFTQPGTSAPAAGVVSGIARQNGAISLVINGASVPLANVLGVST
jgi:flagellar basal-body rod modification protein FlgD